MPQIYDMGPTALLPLRRKASWGFFRPKNRPGLNLQTWILKASTLTLDHRSRCEVYLLLLILPPTQARLSNYKCLYDCIIPADNNSRVCGRQEIILLLYRLTECDVFCLWIRFAFCFSMQCISYFQFVIGIEMGAIWAQRYPNNVPAKFWYLFTGLFWMNTFVKVGIRADSHLTSHFRSVVERYRSVNFFHV